MKERKLKKDYKKIQIEGKESSIYVTYQQLKHLDLQLITQKSKIQNPKSKIQILNA